ncbi:cyclophilin-like fold protein [Oleispirillum naphthae]|uniref:cyclophilin-like fold protein n=1 Tax=Oleispirillum naphthae TaxID=2838853 RepID=UPI0030822549
MPDTVRLSIDYQTFEIALYDNATTRAMCAALPQTIAMTRWGGEYYGSFSTRIAVDSDRRSDFQPGEVALWPAGNAFCIFFGPTPVSTGETPRMASPGVAIGKIAGDIEALHEMDDDIVATLSK